jgi:LPS-assembly protein
VSPITRARIFTCGLCITTAQTAFAQGACLAPDAILPIEAILPSPQAVLGQASPSGDEIDVIYDRVVVDGDSNAEFSGNVELRWRDSSLTTERTFYDRTDETLEFQGRVTYRDPDMTVYGEDAFIDKVAREIRFGPAGFEINERPARGAVQSIEIRDVDRTITLGEASFTTCPLNESGWELTARDVELDLDGGFGTARGVKLHFKGVPILYTPYFSFPISDERKSGFLTPDFSERDRMGLYLSTPYYFNLAPNYDLVLEPRYMTERGMQLANQFRYLMPRSEGEFRFEFLSDDKQTNTDRRYFNLQHETIFTEGWEILAGIEQVSDDAYFEDLGNDLSVTSQTHLDRYLDIGYAASHWSLLTRFQNYQTIDMTIAEDMRPYQRVPQFLFAGNWAGSLVAFESSTELVNFDRNIGTTGWRFDSTQEVSLRLRRAGMYLTPAVAVRQTNYWLDDTSPDGDDDTLSRGLPVASLDAGLVFERETGNADTYLQTLEPRILYVNVPFEDQSMLPVFDTIVPDFNLVQLFRKYQFVGPDRISDTDQLSFGVTTRLIDSGTGRERLSATLGQTRYLTPQRVALPGETPNESSESDYLAEVSVNLRETWNLDVGYQWNSQTDRTARAETRLEYRPQNDRLFGFGYRYRRGLLEQGDLSVVWPVTERWRVIGQYSYSLLEEEPLDQFLGWEYEACCWRLRMIGRQFVSRTTGETDSSFSIQLELKGLTSRTLSPEQLLDRGILGYRRISGRGQP